jgi:UDP-N-acetylglucosamine--N-acetylmuramyl-(pentapeptide) pyrophosphoryl-undecaprenol N-acetylglucosamine transferase
VSFAIAAAGTGGHVYPGLAVAEALLQSGVDRSDVLFVGGDRLEASVYPGEGFDFLELELRGLKRSLSPSNLSLPMVVLRARRQIEDELLRRRVSVVLGMGGYVTIPASMAARRKNVTLMLAEQNAGAGLANRIASRWAERVFVSFPVTEGLESGEWVGNPVRSGIASFERSALRSEALRHFGLVPDVPVLGVFGGSLGASAINEAVARLAAGWGGPALQVIHLVGRSHETTYSDRPARPVVRWLRIGFEDRMDYFYAASDLVVARAGGAVAEITATATPSILVPGDFGSSGHQSANATFLEDAGASVVLPQAELDRLGELVSSLLNDAVRLDQMRSGADSISKPDAAKSIAQAMIEATR